MPALVRQRFYRRPVDEVARSLVGMLLQREEVVLRITEVEAYAGPEDTASHARFGRTARNAPMWGVPGRAYVYLCYGMHQMVNLTTGPCGSASAVLVRAAEPVAGLETIRARRGGRTGPSLLAGPGKIGQALAVDTRWSGHPLYRSGGLQVREGAPPSRLRTGPRVGIDFASPRDARRAWRFAAVDTDWVTRPDTLR